MDDSAFLSELAPSVETLLERHLAASKEWFPHELVPWGQGRDFEPGEAWDPEQYKLPEAVRSALFVNLLTEDNLPYYFDTIDNLFAGEAWRVWARRWTAEEQRHSIVIRDFLTVTRAVDPVALERARMHQVARAVVPQPQTVPDGLIYVALQELATRVAHRNTGKAMTAREGSGSVDDAGYQVMARVAADENLHHLFYRDLTSAALALDPSSVVMAMERQVRTFEMPGQGIVDFARHAMAVAKAGIYNYLLHHDQVLVPAVMRQWRLADLEGLSSLAEEARGRLVRRIERIGHAGRRMVERQREEAQALAFA